MPSRPRFNPRAPCGARPPGPKQRGPLRTFQSTRPVWGATLVSSLHNTRRTFQSTRPVWGATSLVSPLHIDKEVSIHAPRVGRDLGYQSFYSFSAFQSTRPMRGATDYAFTRWTQTRCFNPRAPCGARPSSYGRYKSCRQFQSTRPVWGATGAMARTSSANWFQSTRPVWGATTWTETAWAVADVSIHAPRVGRDDVFHKVIDFPQVSIHAPRVGRDITAPGTIFRPI